MVSFEKSIQDNLGVCKHPALLSAEAVDPPTAGIFASAIPKSPDDNVVWQISRTHNKNFSSILPFAFPNPVTY
jgi:hypothetical protein